jgi:hypothetical protein
MTEQELVNFLKEQYHDVRVLEDGSIAAIGNLLYTRAIYMDCNMTGFGRRFCFADRALADTEFARLKTEDDEPVGWIARR